MIKSEYRRLGTLFFSIVGIAWIAVADVAADPVSLRVVAYSDRQAPGTSGDTRFTDVVGPVINNAGQVAFSATVAAPGSATSQYGLWFEGGGHLNLATVQNAQTYVDFSTLPFAFNDQG